MTFKFSRHGCYPDTKDPRDKVFAVTSAVMNTPLPTFIDLTPQMPPVMDQGHLGACALHGSTAAVRYDWIKAGKPDVELSRLQAYYDVRAMINEIPVDSGCTLRDVMKNFQKRGVAPEVDWPYDIDKFAVKPPQRAYQDSHPMSFIYERVKVRRSSFKYVLVSGYPIVFGATLFSSFEGQEVAQTGLVPMPDLDTEDVKGGHCMLCIGYGQKPGYYTVRNSWGEAWGDKGNCYMPEEYLESPDYVADAWVIRNQD